MKKIFLLVAILATAFAQTGFAQGKVSGNGASLLSSYYNVKEALVAGNATLAASKASELVKAVAVSDEKTVSKAAKKNLLKHAGSIASSKDLDSQRESFSAVSDDVIAVAKTAKLSDSPVYQMYCPMKKGSWLSSEKAVKNPYYGSAMLDCGSIVETYK